MSVSTPTSGRAGQVTGLARLIRTGRDDFARDHWGRGPLLSTADQLGGGGFDSLLDEDAVDELLTTRGLRTPFVRVAKGGRTLPERSFTGPAGVGASITDQVRDDELARLFADGHTVVMQALHRTWEPVMRLVQELSDDLAHPVQANAYITPPQSTGFSAHYDVHDVFVLQISGEKRWRIHAPVLVDPLRTEPWDQRGDAVAEQATGEPALEATMRPGDVLYLPRGWLHSATALGGTSTHLTLGVHTWQGGHVLDALVDHARRAVADDPRVRASLPLGVDLGDPHALSGTLDHVRDALVRAVQEVPDDVLAQSLLGRSHGSRRASPVAPLRTARDLAALEQDPTGWVLRRRDHLGAVLHGGVLRSRAGTVTVAADDSACVTRLLDEGVVPASDLGVDLARRLVLAGLATPDRAA
ncbi:JmjC domain-containing protein [Janibacter melonis]|uniref:cupin domain-containing protein n=1 Tax=Janibacter melonis TaxID=262209 RepID=UPI00177CFDD3|nr:cupin [Janibacter melonis]